MHALQWPLFQGTLLIYRMHLSSCLCLHMRPRSLAVGITPWMGQSCLSPPSPEYIIMQHAHAAHTKEFYLCRHVPWMPLRLSEQHRYFTILLATFHFIHMRVCIRTCTMLLPLFQGACFGRLWLVRNFLWPFGMVWSLRLARMDC